MGDPIKSGLVLPGGGLSLPGLDTMKVDNGLILPDYTPAPEISGTPKIETELDRIQKELNQKRQEFDKNYKDLYSDLRTDAFLEYNFNQLKDFSIIGGMKYKNKEDAWNAVRDANPKYKEADDKYLEIAQLRDKLETLSEAEAIRQGGYGREMVSKLQSGLDMAGEALFKAPSALPKLATDLYNAGLESTGLDQLPGMAQLDTRQFEGPLYKMGEWYAKDSEINSPATKMARPKSDESILKAIKEKDYNTAVKNTISSVIESTPYTFGLAATGGAIGESQAATFGAIFLSTGAQNADQYEKDQNYQFLSPTNRRVIGWLNAFPEGIFETTLGAAQVGRVFSDILSKEGVRKGTKLISNGVSDFVKEVYKRSPIITEPIGGFAEEFGTQVSQNWINKNLGGQDLNLMDGAVDAGIVGFAQQFGSGTTTKVIDAIQKQKEKNKLKQFISPMVNKQTGNIHPAVNKNDGKEYFIVDQNEDGMVIVFEPETQETKAVSMDDLKEGPTETVEGYTTKIQQEKPAAEAAITPQTGMGDQVTLDGKVWTISAINPDGSATGEIYDQEGTPIDTRTIKPEELGTTPQGPAVQGEPVAEEPKTKTRDVKLGKQTHRVEYLPDGTLKVGTLFQNKGEALKAIKEFEKATDEVVFTAVPEEPGDPLSAYRIEGKKNEQGTTTEQPAQELAPQVDESNQGAAVQENVPAQEDGLNVSPNTPSNEQNNQEGRKDELLSPAEQPQAGVEQVTPVTAAETPAEVIPAADLLMTPKEEELRQAEKQVNTEPSEAQKEAGNYLKGHISVKGMEITIENPKGSVRKGTDANGKQWEVELKNTYGYFKRTKGKDGDQIDVFIGDNLNSSKAFIIDQVDPQTNEFDEHKIILGANNIDQARKIYLQNYEPGWSGLGAISEVSVPELKIWLGNGKRKKKPFAYKKPRQKRKPNFKINKDSRTGKVLSREPESLYEAILQFFVSGRRIATKDFRDMTGYKPGSQEWNGLIWAHKTEGLTIDTFAEENDIPEAWVAGMGAMDIQNEVMGVLTSFVKKSAMVEELERIQTAVEEVAPFEDDMPEMEQDFANSPEDYFEAEAFFNENKDMFMQFVEGGELNFDKMLKAMDDDPEYFTQFPYGLNENELILLRNILTDGQAQERIKQRLQGLFVPDEQGQEAELPGDGQANERDEEPVQVTPVSKTDTPKSENDIKSLIKLVEAEQELKPIAQKLSALAAMSPSEKGALEKAEERRFTLTAEALQGRIDKLTESIPQEFSAKIAEIKKAVGDFVGQKAIITDQISRLQSDRRSKEKKLQGRKDIIGDREKEANEKKGINPLFDVPVENTSENLKKALEGFTAKISKLEEELNEKEKILAEQIKDIVSGKQASIEFEQPAAKEEKPAEQPEFSVSEIVIVKGQNGNPDFEANFRGYDKGKAVIYVPKTGDQYSVPVEWLSKKPVQSSGITNVQDVDGKTFQNDDFRKIEIKVSGDGVGAYLTLTDKKGVVNPRPMWINSKDLLDNINTGYFTEAKTEPAKELTESELESFSGKFKPGENVTYKGKSYTIDSESKNFKGAYNLKDSTGKVITDIEGSGLTSIQLSEPKPAGELFNTPPSPLEVEEEVSETEEPEMSEEEVKENRLELQSGEEDLKAIKDFGVKIGGARKDQPNIGTTVKVKGVKKAPRWMQGFKTGFNEKTGKYSPFRTNGRFIVWQSKEQYNSEEEALNMIKSIVVLSKFKVRKAQDGTNYVYRKVGEKKVHTIKEGFPSEHDAYKYILDNADNLLAYKPQFPERPHLDHIERTGKKHREGHVTVEKFLDTFGFTGGEFGNWVPNDERQRMLNEAFDALMDMAEVLNLPPRALSLNGQLSIAFGSRGHGLTGGAAHYETQRAVFNLTRMNGAGSVAHEWFHALDNYFGLQDKGETMKKDSSGIVEAWKNKSKSNMYLSHGHLYSSKARPELIDAFTDFVRSLFKQPKIVEVSLDRYSRKLEYAKKQLEYEIQTLRNYLSQNRSYGKKKDGATDAQMRRFESIVSDIQVNNLGPDAEIVTKAKFFPIIKTKKAIKDLNDLITEITGRSGYTRTDRGFYGSAYNIGQQALSYEKAQQELEKYSQNNKEERVTPTKFYYDSKDIDSMRSTQYWVTEHEMAARAFESYVEDMIMQGGNKSQYLVHSTYNSFYKMFGLNPYPEGQEREFINEKAKKLFEEIKYQTDESGDVVMFKTRLNSEKRVWYEGQARSFGVRGYKSMTDKELVDIVNAYKERRDAVTETAWMSFKSKKSEEEGLQVPKSNKQVGEAFRKMADEHFETLENVLFNQYGAEIIKEWGGEYRVIGDFVDTRNMDMGRSRFSMKEFLNWLVSDKAVDPNDYPDTDGTWRKQINDLRQSLQDNQTGVKFKSNSKDVEPIFSGVVNIGTGEVGDVFTRKQAEAADWHHTFLVSKEDYSDIQDGKKAYFWIDKSGEPQVMDNSLSNSNKIKIKKQVQAITLLRYREDKPQTETKEFKEWFGKSKMVYDNGEPIVAYHGTNREFTTFRSDAGQAHDRGFYGEGFYFTFNKDPKWAGMSKGEAGYYGRNVMPVFLKIENPFDFSELSNYKGTKIHYIGPESIAFLSNVAQRFPEVAKNIMLEKKVWNPKTQEYDISEVPATVLPGLIEKYAKDLKTFTINDDRSGRVYMDGYVKSEIVEYDYTEKGGEKGSYERTEDLGRHEIGKEELTEERKNEVEISLITNAIEKYEGITAGLYPEGYMTRNPEITEAIKAKGHDGIVQSMDGDEAVVFSPTQIKSATDNTGAFDSNNPDIRFKNPGPQFETSEQDVARFRATQETVNILQEKAKNAAPSFVAASAKHAIRLMEENGESQAYIITVKSQLEEAPWTAGFYTDKNVYIIAPNMRSQEEVFSTWVHEQIGHRGIDLLIPDAGNKVKLGKEIFRFLGKAEIERVIGTEYSDMPEFMQGLEYLAYTAEQLINNPSQVTPKQKSFWEWFRSKVMEFLNKVFGKEFNFASREQFDTFVTELIKASRNEIVGYGLSQEQPGNKQTVGDKSPIGVQFLAGDKPEGFMDAGINDRGSEAGNNDSIKQNTVSSGQDRLLAGDVVEPKNNFRYDGKPAYMGVVAVDTGTIIHTITYREYKEAKERHMAYMQSQDTSALGNANFQRFLIGSEGDVIGFPAPLSEKTKRDVLSQISFGPVFKSKKPSSKPTAAADYLNYGAIIKKGPTIKIPIIGTEIHTTREELREDIQDRMLSVKRLQEIILDSGGSIDDNSNPYEQENHSKGIIKAAIDKYNEKLFLPLVKEAVRLMNLAGLSEEQFSRYMKAKHAPERNQTIAEQRDVPYDPKVTNFSGYTTEEADAIVKDMESKLGDVTEFWKMVNQATEYTLKRYLDDGKIDKATYDQLKGRWQFYVPLRGWKETNDEIFDYQDEEGGSAFNYVKSAKGRESESDDPLPYILSMAHTAIVAGEKNRIKQNALRMIIKNSDMKDLFVIKKVYLVNTGIVDADGKEVWDEVIERPDQKLWDEEKVKTRLNTQHQKARAYNLSKQHEVEVFLNGDKYVMVFSDPKVANAINHNNTWAPELTRFLQGTIGKINRWLSSNFTAKNPAFIPVNFIRDFGYAFTAHAMQTGTGFEFLSKFADARGAIKRSLNGKSDLNNPIDKAYQEFIDNGGPTGFVHLYELEDLKKQVNKEIARLKGSSTKIDKLAQARLIKKTGDLMDHMAQMSENLSRFQTYLVSRDKGKSVKESITDAKNITVNFNRSGRISGALGSMFAFFNASIQGSQNMFSLAYNNKGKFAGTAVGFMAMGFLNALINSQWGDDDDEYSNLNDYIKYTNLVVHIGGKQFVTIPLPQGFRMFHSWGVMAYQMMNGQRTPAQVTSKFISSGFEAFSPMNPMGLRSESGKFTLRPITPTAFIPWIDLAANENFAGMKIFKESFTKALEENTADARLGKRNVNVIVKSFTDALFEIGGGNKDSDLKAYFDEDGKLRTVPEAFDWNPSKIEYLIAYYTGGRGQFFNDVVKFSGDMVRGVTEMSKGEDFKEVAKEFETSDIPILKRFIRNSWGNQYTEKFYAMKDFVQSREAASSEAKRKGLYDALGRSYMRPEDVGLVMDYKVTEKIIDLIMDQTKVVTDPAMVKSLTAQRDRVIKDFVLRHPNFKP